MSQNELLRLRESHNWDIAKKANLHNGVWVVDGQSTDPLSYPKDGNSICSQIEDNSFWFKHRNEIVLETLESAGVTKALWEVGSGNGYVSRAIQAAGVDVVAVEPKLEGARTAHARDVRLSISGLFETLALPDDCLPAIGCFDVLEHINRPELLVQEFWRTLEPRGLVVVTVPALAILWSQLDEVSGHFCRYTNSTLDSLFLGNSFELVSKRYFFMSMVPFVFLLRSLPWRLGQKMEPDKLLEKAAEQLSPKSKWIETNLLSPLLSLERCVAGKMPLPLGSSIIGVYRKP